MMSDLKKDVRTDESQSVEAASNTHLETVSKILAAAGRRELIKQSDTEPHFFFHDVLIPYQREQLCRHNDCSEPELVDNFLLHQQNFMGLNHDASHHRLKDGDERYISQRALGQSGRTIVDVVAIKQGLDDSQATKLFARKRVGKPDEFDGDEYRETLVEDFVREVECLKTCLGAKLHHHIVAFEESYTDEKSLGILMVRVAMLSNAYTLSVFNLEYACVFGRLHAACHARYAG